MYVIIWLFSKSYHSILIQISLTYLQYFLYNHLNIIFDIIPILDIVFIADTIATIPAAISQYLFNPLYMVELCDCKN